MCKKETLMQHRQKGYRIIKPLPGKASLLKKKNPAHSELIPESAGKFLYTIFFRNYKTAWYAVLLYKPYYIPGEKSGT